MFRLRNRIRENDGIIKGNAIFLVIVFAVSSVIAVLLHSLLSAGDTALAAVPVLTPFIGPIVAAILKYNDFISVPVKLRVMRLLHERAVAACVGGKGPGTIPAEIGDYLGGK